MRHSFPVADTSLTVARLVPDNQNSVISEPYVSLHVLDDQDIFACSHRFFHDAALGVLQDGNLPYIFVPVDVVTSAISRKVLSTIAASISDRVTK